MEAGASGTLVHLILTVLALIANHTMAAIVIDLILRERRREREWGRKRERRRERERVHREFDTS